MKIEDAASRLEALGNPTRLRIYRTLVKAGDPGLSVGKLQSRLSVPASTLSHHLKTLIIVGLDHAGARCDDADLPRQLSRDARAGGVPGGRNAAPKPTAPRSGSRPTLPLSRFDSKFPCNRKDGCNVELREDSRHHRRRTGRAGRGSPCAWPWPAGPIVLEAGDKVGHAVRQWSHVRMFSPWSYNVDKARNALLREKGWNSPEPEHYPTGGELVAHYLEPLATRTRLKAAHPDQRARRFGCARRVRQGQDGGPRKRALRNPLPERQGTLDLARRCGDRRLRHLGHAQSCRRQRT